MLQLREALDSLAASLAAEEFLLDRRLFGRRAFRPDVRGDGAQVLLLFVGIHNAWEAALWIAEDR
jgi:hypothetical protein